MVIWEATAGYLGPRGSETENFHIQYSPWKAAIVIPLCLCVCSYLKQSKMFILANILIYVLAAPALLYNYLNVTNILI